jgi:Uncharacterized protein conserved in bacteria (DUF2252)
VIEESPEKATRRRRTRMLHKVRGRVGESLFPRRNNSVVTAYVPTPSRKGVHNGERVMTGQHLLQAACDNLLDATDNERAPTLRHDLAVPQSRR